MPRQARLDAPGTLHHVMIRGIERSDLFRDERDRGEFLSRIGELAGATETRILAWALMGNPYGSPEWCPGTPEVYAKATHRVCDMV